MTISFLLVALTVQCPDGTPPPCRSAARASAPAVAPGSIAVFPFSNRSPDSSDAYLADALPEQIIGRLARVSDLRVKSATAVSAQWRRTPDPMASARALRVEWFVTGSIRRSGRQLAVSAELVRVSTGDGAWSAPFRRGDDNVMAVEESIAESVAVAIVGRLAPAQAQLLRRGPSRNPEAYRQYLYGRALVARRTVDDIEAAVVAFTNATRLDPSFAGSWARLAQARTLQRQYGTRTTMRLDSLVGLGRAAWTRARQLDSTLADVWAVGGTMATLDGDLGVAHERLLRALAIDSLEFETYHSFGYLYGVDFLNLPEAGVPLLRRALALNPDFRNSFRHIALLRRDQLRLAEAEALLDTALSFGDWPLGSTERAFVRFLRGNGRGALDDLAHADIAAGSVGILVDTAYARRVYALALGDSSGAREVLARLEARRPDEADWTGIATMRALLGNRRGALDALEELRARPSARESSCGDAPCSVSLRTWRALHNPMLASLRSEPRYQRLLAETRPRVPWLP